MSVRFNWPRYWLPREHEEYAWGGPFLYDPESEYGDVFSKHAKRLDQLGDKRLLILLGEPSAGKSTAVQPQSTDDVAGSRSRLILDLREFNSSQELLDELRDISARMPDGELILDSADEPSIETLASTLNRWLSRDCPPTLRVRVAMRTSTLTRELEDSLNNAGRARGTEMEVRVLAPLRFEDVAEAARTLEIDVNTFVEEIYRVNAAHFAVLAGRLAAMAGAFKRDGKLADTQWQMYEDEVRALIDSERVTVGSAYRHSILSLDHTVGIFSRIAAVSILTGKTTLWVDRDRDAPLGALRIGDVADPGEEAWSDGVSANQQQIDRSLMVGPFRAGASAGEVTWSQRPVAEFLAAKYLTDRAVPLKQICQLLLDPVTHRVPPQLHGLAAMLCSKPGKRSSDLIEILSQRDPHVALRGDLLNMAEEDRQRVAEGLVRQALVGELSYAEFHSYGLFWRLANPRLGDLLRSVIVDRRADEFVRETTIRICEECGLASLAIDLAEVALRNDDALRVRIAAANAIAKVGSDEDRLRLLPALEQESQNDPDHDVRGCTLRAIWPGTLVTLPQVLAALVPPSQVLNYGYYEGFLRDFLETVSDHDVAEVLAWANKLPTDSMQRTLSDLIDGLPERAFRLSADDNIREGLVPLMIRYSDRTNVNGGWSWVHGSDLSFAARFFLAADLHARATQNDWNITNIVAGERGLMDGADLARLLDMIIEGDDNRSTAIFVAQNVGRFYPFDPNPEHVQAVLERKGKNDDFDAAFSFLWAPWDIDSDYARQARDAHRAWENQKDRGKRRLRRKGIPSPRRKCRRWLAAFERGNRDVYWRILRWLALDRYGWGDTIDLYRDIRSLPGWNEESDEFRARLVDASANYLASGHDQPDPWLGKRVRNPRDASAYCAVRLLRFHDRDPDEETYRKWSIALALSPAFASDKEHEKIVKKALTIDAPRTEPALLEAIDADAKATGFVSLGTFVRRRLDGSLGDRLLDLCSGWPATTRFRLLEEAIQAGNLKALAIARDDFGLASDPEISASIACTLAFNGGSEEWSLIVERMDRDDAFGRTFLVALSGNRIDWSGKSTSHLSVDLREWLFGWIEDRYPSIADDGSVGGSYSLNARRLVQRFRDALLDSLFSDGTPGSVASIARLKARFPDISNIDRALLLARLRVLEVSWSWIAPSELRVLLRDPTKSLVRSDEDLQDAIMISLDRLDADLRRTGMSWSLWDEPQAVRRRTKRSRSEAEPESPPKSEPPRPKPEERFSDFVCEWLRRDLAKIAVAPNREVQPRRDERWDILVEVRSIYPRTVHAVVIVEAKLATNTKELWTGMEKQLIDRYMANAGVNHGVYLVGYTYGPRFPEPAHRKPKPQGLVNWRAFWDTEAERVSSTEKTLRSFVLDIGLP